MQKGRVGPVQSVGDTVGMFSGPGFIIYDETGKPALILGHLYESEAETARAPLLMQHMSPAPVRDSTRHSRC